MCSSSSAQHMLTLCITASPELVCCTVHYMPLHSLGRWQRVCTISGYHQRTIYSVDWRDTTRCATSTSNSNRDSNSNSDSDSNSDAGPALIATGAGDDCIRIFRESEGSSCRSDTPSFDLDLTAAKAHAGDVNCVAWAPCQQQQLVLASAGDDCLVKIWQYEPA
jgi:cytosolic iron-sulfur protein assembly protein CIAO1